MEVDGCVGCGRESVGCRAVWGCRGVWMCRGVWVKGCVGV